MCLPQNLNEGGQFYRNRLKRNKTQNGNTTFQYNYNLVGAHLSSVVLAM